MVVSGVQSGTTTSDNEYNAHTLVNVGYTMARLYKIELTNKTMFYQNRQVVSIEGEGVWRGGVYWERNMNKRQKVIIVDLIYLFFNFTPTC